MQTDFGKLVSETKEKETCRSGEIIGRLLVIDLGELVPNQFILTLVF